MNHAVLTGDVFEIPDPEAKDFLYFLLQDKSHQFTISLSDILVCLKFAEEKGAVPDLPADWWNRLEELYPVLVEYLEVPEEENEKI